MRKLVTLMLCLLVSTVTANAAKHGPFPNYDGIQQVGVTVWVPLTTEVGITDPTTGEFHELGPYGGQSFDIWYEGPVFAATYVDVPSPLSAPDVMTIIDVWAKDLGPDPDPGEVPPLTGFDPGDPEIVGLPGTGYYEGQSGTQYPATLDTIMLVDLPFLLPGYDLSKFEGDGLSIVYVQQADVPVGDFALDPDGVPESSGWSLALMGTLFLLGLGTIVVLNRLR